MLDAAGDAPVVIVRQLTYWDATFVGYVDAQLYEKWPFTLDQTQQFAVTVTPTSAELTPLILLLDATGTEITRGSGTLTSTQPAGNYSVLIQPASGAGFYELTLRKVQAQVASVTTSVTPASVNVGESAAVTVSLANVPSEGYSSAEFTCTYDGGVAGAGSIADAGLFGADAATALSGPQNGTFILAIAGSNGNKATAAGNALTFSLQGLQAGQTAVECKARVSKGDNTLTDIQSTAGALTVAGSPTPTSPAPTATGTLPTATATGILPTATGTLPTPTATGTPPTVVPTPETPTPTATPALPGTFTGQVTAGKPVTVSLFKADGSPAASGAANSNGSFSLTAPAGAYTAVASAEGFLKAQGSVTLTQGGSSSLSPISLVAGDIDGNNVIDQYDAMTIGMNYNHASPTAADLNNDGTINVLDLELLAKHYRASGALAWH